MEDLPLYFNSANTILYCNRWQETVHFYKQQLCLPVAFENDWFVEFCLTDTAFLSIANAARATITAVAGQGITLTWQVKQLEEIKKMLERKGTVTTPIREKWGAAVFYCHDPEGHRLEFWSKKEDPGAFVNE
jgi:predicted enzyme related to lactoylglutathione lyase